MATPSLRLRLVFKDRTILTKKQRSDGMNQCWVLIKPQLHKTIADVCTHLVHVFELNRSCPNGVLLSMEGFAFTPFESTEILNDKDIICVKKKGGATTDALEAEDEGNLLEEEVKDDGLENENRGLLLLANDNKGKEVYRSESEDVDEDQLLDEDSLEEVVCKKRKASTNLQNLKKKKRCLGVLDDEDDTETEEPEDLRKLISRKKLLNGNSKLNEETNKTAATSNKNLQSPTTAKRSEQRQKNIEEVNQVSDAPVAKKMSSRSSRRKQLKRRWKQELAKIAKKRPQAYSKPEVTKAGNKEANGHPKGLLHWKQASKNNAQNGDVGPIVSKPGHIRFEFSEEDQPAKQTRVSNETFNRNSSSSKRKGQKWGGRERFLTFQRNESKRISKESFKMLFKDAQVPVIDPNDFDKLPPCCEPKEGDVIAYRLLELNSSWIPELSSFRVGRISYYDAKDIVLIPVPEYPIVSGDIKEDGPNESLYGEDGTLEINYSALVDVRNVEQYVPDATKAASNGVNQTSLSSDMDASENLVSNSNDNNTDVPKDSNPVNPWDQFSKVNPNASQSEMVAYMVASALNQCSDGAAGPSTSTAGHGAAGPSTSTAGPTTGTAGPTTSTAGTTTSTAPDANKEELSKEKDEQQKGDTSDPWLNANKTGPSEVSNVSWTDIQKTGPAADDNCENGSSWGRPWSSFAPSRSSAVKQPNQESNWFSGSSRGNGKPWSRGASRGRGRGGGRGRGRGRNGTM